MYHDRNSHNLSWFDHHFSKYTRIFVIADTYISTLNPQSFEETNKACSSISMIANMKLKFHQYEYVDEFLGIAASGKTPNEFSINVRKRGSKGLF